jgi:hypothetical protein
LDGRFGTIAGDLAPISSETFQTARRSLDDQFAEFGRAGKRGLSTS